MDSPDEPEFRLLKRGVEALEKIAALLEATNRPAVVAPELTIGPPGPTVDGFPRPIKEPT